MKEKKGFVPKKPMFVERLGGKRLTQVGAEYVHKEKETHHHQTGGRPRGRHRPMG